MSHNHLNDNSRRPKSARGRRERLSSDDFANDRDYALSLSSSSSKPKKQKKRPSPSYATLSLEKADMTSSVLVEPAIKQPHRPQQRQQPRRKSATKSFGSFLSRANDLQSGGGGSPSAEFQDVFLSQGLLAAGGGGDDDDDKDDKEEQGSSHFVAAAKQKLTRLANFVVGKRSSPSSSIFSPNKKKRPMVQRDSLAYISPSSQKKRKSKVVVDLVDDSMDTDEDEAQPKPMNRLPPPSVATKKSVYDTINKVTSKPAAKQQVSSVTRKDDSPLQRHALRDSSDDGDNNSNSDGDTPAAVAAESNETANKRHEFKARVEKKQQRHTKTPVPSNFSTALGLYSNSSNDENESDDDEGSFLPKAKARLSKTTSTLQRAQNAAKTRHNPDIAAMHQTKISTPSKPTTTTTPTNLKEVISIDDDDDDDKDATAIKGRPVAATRSKILLRNMMDTPIPRKQSPLPPDLQAPAIKDADGGLLKGFDHKHGEWANAGTPASSSSTHSSSGSSGARKQTKEKRKSKKQLVGNTSDDETGFSRKSKLGEPRKTLDDSIFLRHVAEQVNDDDNYKLQSYSTNDQLNDRKADTMKEKEEEGGFRSRLSSRGKKEMSKGLALTKQNVVSNKRKATRVVPGASSLSSESRVANATEITSEYFQTQKDGDWGGASCQRREYGTTRRESKRISARRDPCCESDDQYMDLELKQNAAIGSSRRRMSRRLTPRNASRQDDPIVLSSDSEEEEEKVSMKLEYELLRISIGKKVFNNGCQLVFQPNAKTNADNLKLRFYKSTRTTSGSLSTTAKREELNMRLTQDTLTIFKVYTKRSFGRDFSFLAMQILPSQETNDLHKYSSAYRPKEGEPSKLQFIVLEFRTDEDHGDCCKKIGETLAPIIGEPGVVARHERSHFAEALIEHSRKTSRTRQKQQSTFTAGRDGESILLVYPFAGDPAQIYGAAKDLREASGKMLGSSDGLASDDDDVLELQPCASKLSLESDAKTPEVKTKVRQTYVTIRVKDYERLDPEEWLNDSLVDFWMQWISRGEDKTRTSLHFFTSHFYTTLLNDGPESVTSWTAKKNINIFEKKFIFIPINKDLHWSLCVVVNPGCIKNSWEDEEPNRSLPCLIFMDSLSLHKRATVRKKVESWLNSEYSRIHPLEDVENPFRKKTFQLFTPGVPRQNNTWDCGVFVCRYAYAIFHLRNRPFTYGAVSGSTPFSRLITGGTEFDFDMNDIVRFRGEFKKLVENLSLVYYNWKREDQTNQNFAMEDAENSKPEAQEQRREDGSEKENILTETASLGTSMSKDMDAENSNIDSGEIWAPMRPDNSSPGRSLVEQEESVLSNGSSSVHCHPLSKTDNSMDPDDYGTARCSDADDAVGYVDI